MESDGDCIDGETNSDGTTTISRERAQNERFVRSIVYYFLWRLCLLITSFI